MKHIRPDPVQRIVPGGRTRPSRLVNLAVYPAVAHRQSVNARLLSGLCGHGAPAARFVAEDAPMLLKIAHERFDSEHALLRRRALGALAQTRSLDAMEALAATALSPIEDESARAAALAALEQAAPSLGIGVAMLVGDDKAPLVRIRARKSITALAGAARPVRRRRTKRVVPAKDR